MKLSKRGGTKLLLFAVMQSFYGKMLGEELVHRMKSKNQIFVLGLLNIEQQLSMCRSFRNEEIRKTLFANFYA